MGKEEWYARGSQDASEGHRDHEPGLFVDKDLRLAYGIGHAYAMGQIDRSKGRPHNLPNLWEGADHPLNRAYNFGYYNEDN